MAMVYLRNVTTLALDEAVCTGCGACALVCPHDVLRIRGGRAHIGARDACMECGACVRNCPAGALGVRRGVGCAAAVINGMLGRTKASCCSVDAERERAEGAPPCTSPSERVYGRKRGGGSSGCC